MKHIFTGSLLLLSSGLYAASISNVEHGNGAGGYQVVFKNAGVKPQAFNTDSSIVLDFPNTTSSMKTRGVDVAKNGIYNVEVIPGQGRTRAVINLSAPTTYNVSLQGQDVVVSVAANTGRVAKPVASNTAKGSFGAAVNKQVGTGTATIGHGVNTVSALAPKFNKTGRGNGAQLTFNLPSPDTVVNLRKDGNRVVAEIPNISIANSEQKQLDVRDYSTPVNTATIQRSGSGAKITLVMGGNAYEFVNYQSGTLYTIEIRKPAQSEQDKKVQEMLGFGNGKQYRGEPLSLNFQDIEVRAVLQIIAEFTKNNIVVSDGVTGNITLRLDNVPWDQALDIILKTKGLDKRQSGGVIYVATIEELGTSELRVLEDLKKRQQLMPTRMDRIQIQFARAADLKKLIEDAKKNNNTSSNNNSYDTDSILSERGTISVDERTNTLIVTDVPDRIQAVRELVTELDKPVKQVLIDSRIVLTEDNYARDLGARFGVSFVNPNSNSLVVGSGRNEATTQFAIDSLNGTRPRTMPDLSNRLGVNMPVTGGTNGNPASYGLSILSGDFLVDLELSALQTEGRVEILSSPRVVTQDGAVAEVWSGTEVPIITKDEDGTNNLETVTAALRLNVTPRIAPNNMVDMELNINNDELGNNVSVAGATQVTKLTSGVKTNVLVDNGETIVLGGVYKQTQRASTDKVPILGDIPVIGHAFKKNSRTFNKSEMLIFVTPRIVDKRLVDNDKFANLPNR